MGLEHGLEDGLEDGLRMKAVDDARRMREGQV
jgi:hypothetical protein